MEVEIAVKLGVVQGLELDLQEVELDLPEVSSTAGGRGIAKDEVIGKVRGRGRDR